MVLEKQRQHLRSLVCKLRKDVQRKNKSIICSGMLEPTHGKVLIEGFDIQKNLQQARKLLGFCPQYGQIFFKPSVQKISFSL